MPYPADLRPYFIYSFLLHLAVIGWIVLGQFAKQTKKVYYAVDFIGGMPAGGPAEPIVQKAKEPEAVKTKMVNPQEDLLIKSKKKQNKKEKEVISAIPAPPPPPAAKSLRGAEGAAPAAIPQTGSGVGIGFGSNASGSTGGNFPYTWYVHTVKKKLDTNWNVAAGFSNRIYTQVVFIVKKDGSLAEVQVEETSKNEVFDRAAIRAVESSGPFPPLPADFSEPELRVHVRFTVKK